MSNRNTEVPGNERKKPQSDEANRPSPGLRVGTFRDNRRNGHVPAPRGRICRPVGMSPEDRAQLIDFAVAHIGDTYDLKNVFDLARYLLPTPPVPQRWRRRLLSMGSGDPTRAICSTLIAQAFQSVGYPVLPRPAADEEEQGRTAWAVRHHSLFTPRDFDLSPYFATVKPTIESGFDYKNFNWKNKL